MILELETGPAPGALLEPSWTIRGPLSRLSWVILRNLSASESLGSEKGETPHDIEAPQLFEKDFGLSEVSPGRFVAALGAVLEWSWGLLEHRGNQLESSWDLWSHIRGHLGLSQALLESS